MSRLSYQYVVIRCVPRVDREEFVNVGVVLFVALLVSYPWHVLTAGSLLYLASLPFGWLSYRQYMRKDAEAVAAKVSPGAIQPQAEAPLAHPGMPKTDDEERPSRLN